MTPLMHALENQRFSKARLLLRNGADPYIDPVVYPQLYDRLACCFVGEYIGLCRFVCIVRATISAEC
jgi:hypothetical protein